MVNYFVVILVAGNHFMNLSTVSVWLPTGLLGWMVIIVGGWWGGLYVASSWKFNIVINSFFRHYPCGLHNTIVAIVTELHRNHFQGLI